MKVLIVNTSERNGGAAVAANRLLHGLRQAGVEANMLVCDRQTEDPHVVSLPRGVRHTLKFVLERVHIFVRNHLSRKNLFAVSIANTGYDITQLSLFQEADVVHLHWINQGMLSLKNLKAIKQSGKPVVWTMHDMWPLTGICHHAYGCERFTENCGCCPFLNSSTQNDLSYSVFNEKKSVFDQWAVSMVAVSTWLAGLGERSRVLSGHPVTVIPNAVPLDVFVRMDRVEARRQLGLPQEKKLLVFGAAMIDYPVKGFGYLKEALEILVKKMDSSLLHLVLYGGIKSGPGLFSDLPISSTWLGKVTQETLPVIFSACDVLVAPSLYETFGQTIIEAQSCGCIPVCFGNSGQTDIIEPGKTGLFASYRSSESLAEKLYEALTTFDQERFAGIAADSVWNRFSIQRVSSMYVDVYSSVLKLAPPRSE